MSTETKKKTSSCEECKKNPSKYTCPGCSIRTCGLDCVKSHKKRTSCNGKRKATEFVPISEFNDEILLSDYNLLEDTKRVTESANRRKKQLIKHEYKLPYYSTSLWGAAKSRRTSILFLASGMMKREQNQSRYSKETKCISWTIEWRFNSTDVVVTDHGVGEDTNLCSVIENHIKLGPCKNKLKAFCDVDLNSLKLFVRANPNPMLKKKNAHFKELDIKAPLRKQLANVVVIEYPVIHVYLPTQSFEFEVIKDSKPRNTTPNPTASLCDGQGVANGVPFQEEELEDEEEDDMKVLDLFRQRNLNPCQQVSECSKVEGGFTEEEDAGFAELKFEQADLDTYSDVFPELNPGDYFDFEFEKGFDSEDNLNLAADFLEMNSGDDHFYVDELEEGEISE